MKFVMHLSKNGRLPAQKKKKYQYKYSARRKKEDFFLNNSNLTEIKTLIEKGMMLGLEKGKRTGHQIETIIQEAEAEVKLEIATTDKIKVKTLKGFYFYQEITKTEAPEVKPRIIVKNMIKIIYQKIEANRNILFWRKKNRKWGRYFTCQSKKLFFTHLETEMHVWTKQLTFYNNKLFKLLAIINQILLKLSGKIYYH